MRNALLTSTSRRPYSSTVRVDERRDLLGVDEVGRHRERPAAVGLDLGLHLGEVLGVAGRQHHGGALPGERPGVGLAQPRTDPRHDRRPCPSSSIRHLTGQGSQPARPGPTGSQMPRPHRANASGDRAQGRSAGVPTPSGAGLRGPMEITGVQPVGATEPGLGLGHGLRLDADARPGDARPRSTARSRRRPRPRALYPEAGRVPARRQADRPAPGAAAAAAGARRATARTAATASDDAA